MTMKLKQAYTLDEIADLIDADLQRQNVTSDNNAEVVITGIATIDLARAGEITFLANRSYRKYLASTQATAVIIDKDDVKYCPVSALVTENPRLSLARLMQQCVAEATCTKEIHASVVIGTQCNIDEDVSIAAHCVIGNNVTIMSGVRLEAGVVVGDGCMLGKNSYIKPNTTLYANVKIGSNTTIHSGTVIGSDGFGYANDQGNWVKMPHLGCVVIGDNVEIGSNVSIDRGFIGDTTICNGVIIDNMVQLGHNVFIGEKTAIAGCVGIAGSTKIGSSCLIAGGVGIAGHLDIGDNVTITARSAVNRSLQKPGVYSSGLPAKENHLWRKNVARFNLLDSLAKRVRKLEHALEVNLD